MTDNFSSQLVVVDGVTNQVIDRIQTGQAYFPDGMLVPGPCITQASSPFGVSISEKTNRLYVIDIQDGTLYVIDGATDRVMAAQEPEPTKTPIWTTLTTCSTYPPSAMARQV